MAERAPFHYNHSGLRIASQLELPEWNRFACSAGEMADVTIIIDPSLASTGLGPHEPLAAGDSLVFDDEDAGTYAAVAGREIRIAPKFGASEREIRLFALGSAWGAIGYQRGLCFLHGSAVMGPRGAVLFAGEAGAGKSTFAAAMSERGHLVIADDLSRVDNYNERAEIWPSASRIKLWDDALEQLGWTDRPMEPDHFRDRKFHFDVASGQSGNPVPLSACYILTWGEPKITQLTGAEAVAAILSATMYRNAFLRALGKLGQYTADIAKITSAIEVFRLSRPRELIDLSESCAMVEKHWQQ